MKTRLLALAALVCALLPASFALAQTQPLPAALGGGGQYMQNVPVAPCIAPAGGGNGTCAYVAPDHPLPAMVQTYNGSTYDTLLSVKGAGGLGTGTGVAAVSDLAPGTPETCSSGNVANASATCTLATASGKTTFISGFQCTAAGATAASVVSVTVAGVVTGTMTYTFAFPAGVTTAAQPLVISFNRPIPASATNTAIVVTLPAGGAGNTNASCSAQGSLL